MSTLPHSADNAPVVPIQTGRTYTIVPPTDDPSCVAFDCELHRADRINPWLLYVGKKVTVVETGLEHAGHDAVRVTTGPVDWHPRIAVRLTDEQMRALGVPPGSAPTTYLMLGHVWAVDVDVAAAFTNPDGDDLPWGSMAQVEMPQQRTEVIPVACLRDGVLSPEERRREERLRRVARSRGLRLRKIRGYLPTRINGPYVLENPRTRTCVAGSYFMREGVGLDEIEAQLGVEAGR